MATSFVSRLNVGVGVPTGPFLDATGNVTPAWRAFLLALYERTGGAIGQEIPDTAKLEAEIAAERIARIASDQQLTVGIGNEAVTRARADNGLTGQITSEQHARIVADNLMVPKTQLCSLWAQCDLSFLPRADPGHGMPWLNDNVLSVGTSSTTASFIGLEDGTGFWTLEASGTAQDWVWG